jgi:hypothetical protein
VKARSVPPSRATRYCSGVSFERQSASAATVLDGVVESLGCMVANPDGAMVE